MRWGRLLFAVGLVAGGLVLHSKARSYVHGARYDVLAMLSILPASPHIH